MYKTNDLFSYLFLNPLYFLSKHYCLDFFSMTSAGARFGFSAFNIRAATAMKVIATPVLMAPSIFLKIEGHQVSGSLEYYWLLCLALLVEYKRFIISLALSSSTTPSGHNTNLTTAAAPAAMNT